MIAASARVAADPSCEVVELLAFLVSGEEFCLPIMRVREIRTWSEPTPAIASFTGASSLTALALLDGRFLRILNPASLLPARTVDPA